MKKILCIETSDQICSVAVRDNSGKVLSLESEEAKSHARVITVLIDNILKKANLQFEELDAIAVSSGPGSYTGLRIGISVAKGLCFTLDKPLISIDVFDILKRRAEKELVTIDKKIFAMIDARRMEVYAQKWNADGLRDDDAFPLILDESFCKAIDPDDYLLIGNGSSKANSIYEEQAFYTYHEILPHAEFMVEDAEDRLEKGIIEDTAYFEPFYLKEFYITRPKNILNLYDGKGNSKQGS